MSRAILGLRVHKYLLKAPEKEKILNAMRTSCHAKTAEGWAWEFKRLPATIRKLAAEAGIRLIP